VAATAVAANRAAIAAVMDDPAVDDPRVAHLRYHEVISDPVSTIRSVYDRFGMPFTAEHDGRMQRWLDGNRSDRYGKFRYSLDVLGVPAADLYRAFEPYLERFGVRRENG
jgi:hypothetical protein